MGEICSIQNIKSSVDFALVGASKCIFTCEHGVWDVQLNPQPSNW